MRARACAGVCSGCGVASELGESQDEPKRSRRPGLRSCSSAGEAPKAGGAPKTSSAKPQVASESFRTLLRRAEGRAQEGERCPPAGGKTINGRQVRDEEVEPVRAAGLLQEGEVLRRRGPSAGGAPKTSSALPRKSPLKPPAPRRRPRARGGAVAPCWWGRLSPRRPGGDRCPPAGGKTVNGQRERDEEVEPVRAAASLLQGQCDEEVEPVSKAARGSTAPCSNSPAATKARHGGRWASCPARVGPAVRHGERERA